MSERIVGTPPTREFISKRRVQAQALMGMYMLGIGEQAGLEAAQASNFALQVVDRVLPTPRVPRNKPDNRVLTIVPESRTVYAQDRDNQLLGFIKFGDSATSTASRFHRLDRFAKMHRPGEDAFIERPRLIYDMAFRPGANVERALLGYALRSIHPKQAVIVDVVGSDPAVDAALEHAGVMPSMIVEPVGYIDDYPEIRARRYFGRSAMHACGRLMAAAPTP